MAILNFGKPPKAMSTEAHQSISADGAPPGVYTPNMSTKDAEKWRAKLVGSRSKNYQIEIRKQVSGTNILLVVNGKMINARVGSYFGCLNCSWTGRKPEKDFDKRPYCPRCEADVEPLTMPRDLKMLPHHVQMSANGKMHFDQVTFQEMAVAVKEAENLLGLIEMPELPEKKRKGILQAIREGVNPLDPPTSR